MSPEPVDTTPSQEPWNWLQDLEPSGAANDCACYLETAGPNGTPGAAFYMCSLHQQAQVMHTALRDTLYALERGSFGP